MSQTVETQPVAIAAENERTRPYTHLITSNSLEASKPMRTTRSRSSVGVAPVAAPAAESSTIVRKRKQPPSSSSSASNVAAMSKENNQNEAQQRKQLEQQMVMEAYQKTLQSTQVKSLASDFDSLAVAKQSNQSQSPRQPLQPRDANIARSPASNSKQVPSATNMEVVTTPTQVTLSPRTLLVPSKLPPTLLQVDSAMASPMAALDLDDEEIKDEPEAEMPSLAPPVTAHPQIDGRHALPAPYVTINPDMLRDAAWNFRDLQLLCMRLNLGGRGTRAQLVERLTMWHRQCFQADEATDDEEDDHPLSIRKRMKNASNFALLQLDTNSMLMATVNAPQPAAAPSTPPLSPDNDHANGPLASVTVSSSLPQLLTPLLYRTARKQDGTPRSILSPSVRPKSSSKRLSFSVFNGVKLIPNRAVSNEEMANHTPSPTKRLDLNEADEDMELQQEAANELQQSPPPNVSTRPSFLSSVSSACNNLLNALSPRKNAPTPLPSPPPCASSFSASSHFTFDRLPSIEQNHGDESESDSSMETSADQIDPSGH